MSLPLPSISLEPVEGQADANLAGWRTSVSTLFDVDPLCDPLHAAMRGWSLSTLLFGWTQSGRQRFMRTPELIRRSAIDHLLVQFYVEGGFEGVAEGEPIRVRPGEIIILDLSRSFEIVAKDFVCVSLVVPRHLLRILPGDFSLHGGVFPPETALARLVAHHLVGLTDICATARASDCEQIVAATLALLSLLVESSDARKPAVELRIESSLFTRLCGYIDAHLGEDDLTVDRLCLQFGLSRASLYRMFDPIGGVATHIRNRRLDKAFGALLVSTAKSDRISAIAERLGFRNEDTFARAFKARYDVSPRELRQRGLGALATLERGGEPVDNILGQWLRSLGAGHAGAPIPNEPGKE